MDSNIGFLTQLYGSAVTPFVIADESLSILWMNQSAESYNIFSTGSIGFLVKDGEKNPREGRISVNSDGLSSEFSVIKYRADVGAVLYIVEYLGTDSPCDLPEVRNYVGHICGMIRRTVSMVDVAAKDINKKISEGESGIASELNKIAGSSFMLLKEGLIPELLYYSEEAGSRDEVICVENEVSRFIDKLKTIIGSETEIKQNSKKNVFTHMHREIFEMILSHMTADCCSRGFYPEKISFSLNNETPTPKRSTLTVKAMGALPKEFPSAGYRGINNTELFERRFIKLLNDKYGVTFRTHVCPNSISIVMEFTRCLRKPTVKNHSDFVLSADEYTAPFVVLSEKFPRRIYRDAENSEHITDKSQ